MNGVAERYNKTFKNKMRALMINSGLQESMWVFAVNYANHIYNRTPHKSNDFIIREFKINQNIKFHIDNLKDLVALLKLIY